MFSGMDVTTRSLLQTGRDFELYFVFYNVNGVTAIILVKDGTNSESG
jgi:hypothetical protein